MNDIKFPIKGWMIHELNLTGNKLLIFALIHEESNRQFKRFPIILFAKVLKVSKPTVIKALKELTKEGAIQKKKEWNPFDNQAIVTYKSDWV